MAETRARVHEPQEYKEWPEWQSEEWEVTILQPEWEIVILRPKQWWGIEGNVEENKRPYIVMLTHDGEPLEIRRIVAASDESDERLVSLFMRGEGELLPYGRAPK